MKQCVDPKLNNDYPPKAIAKVCSLIIFEWSVLIYKMLYVFVFSYRFSLCFQRFVKEIVKIIHINE